MSDEELPIRPAATVIVLRDGEAGLETLLLRRSSQIAFHGGAWVFPGGGLDAADYGGAPMPDDPQADAHEPAARVAAVREAFEEAGLRLDPDQLVPFSHWTTPAMRIKRYATWFFLVGHDDSVSVDGSEITDHRWMSPTEALAARDAGEIELAPPTYVTLIRLAESTTVADAVAEAESAPYLYFEPHIRPLEGGFVSIYAGDVAYGTDAELTDPGPRHRLRSAGTEWSYENSVPPLAAKLGLAPHPEGGWYRETWRSPVPVTLPDGRVRSTGTLIWFLLPAGESSAWHRVSSDEIWLAQQGSVSVELGGSDAKPEEIGDRHEVTATQQVVVPAGVWQRTLPGEQDALVSCLVSPGFDFADFELAE